MRGKGRREMEGGRDTGRELSRWREGRRVVEVSEGGGEGREDGKRRQQWRKKGGKEKGRNEGMEVLSRLWHVYVQLMEVEEWKGVLYESTSSPLALTHSTTPPAVLSKPPSPLHSSSSHPLPSTPIS